MAKEVTLKSSDRNSLSTIQRSMLSAANALDNIKNNGELDPKGVDKAMRNVMSVLDWASPAWKQRVI